MDLWGFVTIQKVLMQHNLLQCCVILLEHAVSDQVMTLKVMIPQKAKLTMLTTTSRGVLSGRAALSRRKASVIAVAETRA